MTTQSKAVLVVDDEESMCEMLELALKKWGHRVRTARNLREAMAAVERGRVDAVLSDIKLPDGSGVDLLHRLKTLPERPPVLLMTAFGNTEAAVQAMRLGAFYYITKPFKLEELKVLLERALTEGEIKKENETLKQEVKKDFSVASIIGAARPMKDMFELIERVSKTKTNILITGESGTGKELVARAIHYGGPLKNKPFVAVNCGAIPENLIESELFGHKRGSFTGAVVDKDGLFQVASGGTIFLDEVGELPMSMQVKLLRVLQDKSVRPVGGTEDSKVDVRVISATNRDLEAAIRKNTFREDLYYRLNVIQIKTPPLRQRKEDIPVLVDHFLKKLTLGMGKQVSGVTEEVMQVFAAYDFPGNVRELENTMERAIALEGTDLVTVNSLPPAMQKIAERLASGDLKAVAPAGLDSPVEAAGPPHDVNRVAAVLPPASADLVLRAPAVLTGKLAGYLDVDRMLDSGRVDLEKIVGEIEKEYILKALERTGGVKKKAAELLGVTFRSIRYRISKLGIHDVEGDS